VNPKNPELIAAREKNIPVIQRAEMLAELMGLKRSIAIGGTHGKTTTTSLVATMMIHSGLDPTVVVGGRLDLIKSSAKLGQGEWLVAEADESDGSFLRLAPEMAVITNIDDDHLDHFKSMDNLRKAFRQFAEHIPFYGCTVLCADDPLVLKLTEGLSKRKLLYGLTGRAELRGENLKVENGFQKFLGACQKHFNFTPADWHVRYVTRARQNKRKPTAMSQFERNMPVLQSAQQANKLPVSSCSCEQTNVRDSSQSRINSGLTNVQIVAEQDHLTRNFE
jgi:UDP-N-acetylmuramate-alanine ligase